jgi:hypothetical protein
MEAGIGSSHWISTWVWGLGVSCGDRVLDGPVSGEKESKHRNKFDCIRFGGSLLPSLLLSSLELSDTNVYEP